MNKRRVLINAWLVLLYVKKKGRITDRKKLLLLCFFVGLLSLQVKFATNWSRGKKKKKCFCSQENRSIDLVECNDFASSCQFLSVFHLLIFCFHFFSWKINTDCCHGKGVLCSYVLIGLGIIFAHTWMIKRSIFHLYPWWFQLIFWVWDDVKVTL